MPTDFDWRIGVLDRRAAVRLPLLHGRGPLADLQLEGGAQEGSLGGFEPVPLDLAPKAVLKTAVKAANLIGDGLYGVDLKQVGAQACYVIEVNDNPNIDSGIEDRVMGESLYRAVMRSFRDRIERARRSERIPL